MISRWRQMTAIESTILPIEKIFMNVINHHSSDSNYLNISFNTNLIIWVSWPKIRMNWAVFHKIGFISVHFLILCHWCTSQMFKNPMCRSISFIIRKNVVPTIVKSNIFNLILCFVIKFMWGHVSIILKANYVIIESASKPMGSYVV